jgi:hypothetical protein
MKKVYLSIGLAALMLMVALLFLTSAFAFSLSLQNLRINAASFASPAASVLLASPMTSADEAEIGKPQSDSIRFEDFQQSEHVCNRTKTSAQDTGF